MRHLALISNQSFLVKGIQHRQQEQFVKFILTVLVAVAGMECELTVEQQIREGMAEAKLYGNRSGRLVGQPPREIPASFKVLPDVERRRYHRY